MMKTFFTELVRLTGLVVFALSLYLVLIMFFSL